MRGLTSPLWPIRYKPLPDELLSSWLVRLARGHGLKVQTFCNAVFGSQQQVWNRDIDRLAPPWLLDAMALHTGASSETTSSTTLRVYEGTMFRAFRSSGHLPWIQTMMMYHRKREGFGQQYCPGCLASDPEPYFRKSWRLSLKTFCIEHQCMLVDRCESCGSPVSFHRMDIGMTTADSATRVMTACHHCGFDLSSAPTVAPTMMEPHAGTMLRSLVAAADSSGRPELAILDADYLAILRHMTNMILSAGRHHRLAPYLAELFGVADPVDRLTPQAPIEAQSVGTRHIVVQWAVWLADDLPLRAHHAIKSKAMRYNHLVTGFESAPQIYVDLVRKAVPHKRRSKRRRAAA